MGAPLFAIVETFSHVSKGVRFGIEAALVTSKLCLYYMYCGGNPRTKCTTYSMYSTRLGYTSIQAFCIFGCILIHFLLPYLVIKLPMIETQTDDLIIFIDSFP